MMTSCLSLELRFKPLQLLGRLGGAFAQVPNLNGHSAWRKLLPVDETDDFARRGVVAEEVEEVGPPPPVRRRVRTHT